MIGFISALLGEPDLVPTGACLHWYPDLVTWTVLGDGGLSVAFTLLPIVLFLEARRRRLTMPPWVLLLLGTFALLNGLLHDSMIFSLFYPAYWMVAVLKNVAAVVAMLTVALLPFATPRNGNSILWWRRARALRHELRSARANINLLRDQLKMPAMKWPDDTLPPGPEDGITS